MHLSGQALSDMPFSAQRLHVLDERCALAPARDLAYNDAPWVPAQQDARFVHPKLSNQVPAHAPPPAERAWCLKLTRSGHYLLPSLVHEASRMGSRSGEVVCLTSLCRKHLT